MQALVEEVGKVRASKGGGRMVVESSPVNSSQSNGVIERCSISGRSDESGEERVGVEAWGEDSSSEQCMVMDGGICGLALEQKRGGPRREDCL